MFMRLLRNVFNTKGKFDIREKRIETTPIFSIRFFVPQLNFRIANNISGLTENYEGGRKTIEKADQNAPNISICFSNLNRFISGNN
jgi:hypothetical protein